MRSWKLRLFILFLMALLLMACATLTERLSPEPAFTPETLTAQNNAAEEIAGRPAGNPFDSQSQAEEEIPSQEQTPEKSDSGSGGLQSQVVELPSPPAIASQTPAAETERIDPRLATFELLDQAQSPERDEIEVARLYKGLTTSVVESPPIAEALPVGTVQQINVLNRDTIMIEPIEVELLAVGQHAYYWFDTGPGPARPWSGELDPVVEAFDEIYEQIISFFGSENNPGVDGDSRVHVVNASPLALCDVTLDTADNCGTAGYFSAFNAIPSSVDPESNAREMFVMNSNFFTTNFYLSVLAHEFRHMIEDNHDRGDADWEAEGSATLAQDLVGFSDNGRDRGNMFLAQPDQQLNNWTDGNTLPYYGQGYLLNRYIYDRLGQDFYRQFATSSDSGLMAIDALAAANGLDLTGEALWLDWLAALAIHDEANRPEQYRLDVPGLDRATMSQVSAFPASFEETVHQYAADYYHITGEDTVSINFSGDALAPLLDTMPISGDHMWLANRANFSHMHLSRPVDLRQVDTATLNYNVYHDIEVGYDFAYVFVSEDGGRTWQPLVGENMQGLEAGDDPAGSALADRFYTGRSDGWRQERIDLTPYAGKEIQIRFAYLTDLILTFGGIALDDIEIPEIGFFDDAETPFDGWLAEGFERVTGEIPQRWHLQLITFPNGVPTVQFLPLSEEQTLEWPLSLTQSGGEAILIVSASSPMTLETAGYELVISG